MREEELQLEEQIADYLLLHFRKHDEQDEDIMLLLHKEEDQCLAIEQYMRKEELQLEEQIVDYYYYFRKHDVQDEDIMFLLRDHEEQIRQDEEKDQCLAIEQCMRDEELQLEEQVANYCYYFNKHYELLSIIGKDIDELLFHESLRYPSQNTSQNHKDIRTEVTSLYNHLF